MHSEINCAIILKTGDRKNWGQTFTNFRSSRQKNHTRAYLMSNNKLAKLLTDTLPSGRRRLFNPWRDRCADDVPSNGPDAKLARLAAHLDCDPKFILCGEAPSYRGCRHSGIAFTSEHLLLVEGKIPRMSPVSHRLTIKKGPYKEGSGGWPRSRTPYSLCWRRPTAGTPCLVIFETWVPRQPVP